jgi:uncharacterized protein
VKPNTFSPRCRLGLALTSLAVLLAAVGASRLLATVQDARSPARDYPIQPVPFTAVTVTDDFWRHRIDVNRTATIPAIFARNRETGRVENFNAAARPSTAKYTGQRYNDTDVYKAIEGASYSLATTPDPAVDRTLDELISVIAAAQEPDGYLFTARTADPEHPIPGIGAARWSELTVSHELYNAGHLYEAAVAHVQTTGKRTLLDVAVRNANLVARVFGPDKRHGFPGHQEIEIGLSKLYRVTGDRRYLDLARYFLEQRGHDVLMPVYPPGSRFAIYNDPVQIQAQRPPLEQDEAVGHAVRAMYMYSGMADVAALSGDSRFVAAIDRLWENVVGKKLYLTGGVGSRHDGESFGPAYDLPNRTAYNETCAAIGNAFWNQRMFLLHGDARYLDVMERVVYNGLISGVSLDGTSFFYPNPLESDGKFGFNQGDTGRARWFDVACCPGNISRFIPSMPGYIYATAADRVYVNLFVGSRARMPVGGQQVAIAQETRYPWEGVVTIRVDPERGDPFAVYVRIPEWARGVPAPGGLYRYLDAGARPAAPSIAVNGKAVPLDMEKGFARVRRAWTRGDTITLRLPMAVRRVVADAAVDEDAGRVALERGPIVYCVEWPDNGGHVLDLALPDRAPVSAEFRPGLLNGVVVLRAPAVRDPAGAKADLVAIPYYAWANRGSGEMTVWVKRPSPSSPSSGVVSPEAPLR